MVAVTIGLVAVLSLILGIVSLKSRDRIRLSFSAFSFVVSAWVLVNFVFQISGNKGLVRSFYAIGALAICAGLVFTFHFLYERIHRAVWAIVIGLGVANCCISLFTDLVIDHVDQVFATGYKAETGSYFLFYSLFIVIGVLAFFAVTISRRKRSEGVKRNQITWIMAGFGLFGLVTAVVSFILPLFDVWTLTSLDSPSAIFFVLASFYAITRYRLMDLRIVVRKSFYYFMLTVFVFLVYYLNVFLDEHAFGGQYSVGAYLSAIVIAPLFLLGFTYVSRILQRIVNKYFFTGLYDPQETLKTFASRISQTIKLADVASVIIDTIRNSLRADAVAVAVRGHPRNTGFVTIRSAGFDMSAIMSVNDASTLLERHYSLRKPVITEELASDTVIMSSKDYSRNLAKMQKTGIAAVLPLGLKDKVTGIVIIGNKATKEAFTKGDIDLLGTFTNQASVAVENARLYNSMEEIVAEQTQDIKDKNEHLQELLKMKSEFLSIASHQLRTPLTAVRGLLAIQADGDLDKLPDDERRKQQRAMLTAADHLNNIVNDLLDAMELEGGHLKFNFQPVDIQTLIQEAVDELKPNFLKKGLTIKVETPSRPLPKIDAESKYLREAIMDVIDNAEKYTNRGGITIRTSLKDRNIRIMVKDTGIGIPKSDFPRLFRKFSRGEKSSFQHANGSGLGLFIIRNILAEHHGNVNIESEGEGKGTEVTLTLPVRQPPKPEYNVK